MRSRSIRPWLTRGTRIASDRRRKRLRLSYAAAAVLMLASHTSSGATLENFNIGNWLVGAYSNDATGQFSHCGMSASYKSGILMIFAIGRDFQWALAFADPQWKLSPGASYDLTMQIDGGAPIPARATAVTNQEVTIALQDNVALFERFRHGYQLRVNAAGQEFFFNLTGTSRALNAVLNCTQRHVASYAPSLNSNPFIASSRQAEGTERATWRAEATTFAANLLSQAGISGFRILQPSETPKEWANFDAVWAAPSVVGIVNIIAPQAGRGADQIRSNIVASDARTCKGKFASGFVPPTDSTGQSSSVEFFTACDAAPSVWAAYYTLVPREAGGFYLVGSMGSGADTGPAKSAEDSLWTATRATPSR